MGSSALCKTYATPPEMPPNVSSSDVLVVSAAVPPKAAPSPIPWTPALPPRVQVSPVHTFQSLSQARRYSDSDQLKRRKARQSQKALLSQSDPHLPRNPS